MSYNVEDLLYYNECLDIITNPTYYLRDFLQGIDKKSLTKIDNMLAARYGHPASGLWKTDDFTFETICEMFGAAMLNGDCKKELPIVLKGLNPRLRHPSFCAKLMSRKLLLRSELRVLQTEISDFLPKMEHLSKRHSDNVSSFHNDLDVDEYFAFQSVSDYVNSFETAHDYYNIYCDLYESAKIEEMHPIYPVKYSLYIPKRQKLLIADPIGLAILESTKNPSSVYNLSPREFERFIATIFESFGYETQLTARTRDGGADIICLCKSHKIPIKVAIEVKRYSPAKPIGVAMVRQFVGANHHLKANKLVYVTTSKYSPDARKYANTDLLVNLLELKELPDIIRWANDFKEIKRHQTI